MNSCDAERRVFLPQKKPDTPELLTFPKDEWELPKDEFTLGEELGSGYFANVHRGRWKNLVKVAIKILKSGEKLLASVWRRGVEAGFRTLG